MQQSIFNFSFYQFKHQWIILQASYHILLALASMSLWNNCLTFYFHPTKSWDWEWEMGLICGPKVWNQNGPLSIFVSHVLTMLSFEFDRSTLMTSGDILNGQKLDTPSSEVRDGHHKKKHQIIWIQQIYKLTFLDFPTMKAWIHGSIGKSGYKILKITTF